MVFGHVDGRVVADHFHSHPSGCGNRVRLDHVVRLAERDDQRVEVVEPVGTPAEHPERQRELRVRGGPDAREPHAAAAAHRASAAHSSSPSDSARAVGGTPAHSSTSVARSPRSGRSAPEHLAALRKPAADEGEELGLRRHRHRRRFPPAQPHEHRLDLRSGHEHGGRHRTEQRGLGVVRDLHRHRPVLLATGPGGEALAHLTLDHHHDPGDGRGLFEEPDHHGHGHVVGKVGDARPLRALREELRKVDRARVADAHVDLVRIRSHRRIEHALQHARVRRRARRRGRVRPARAARA